MESADSMAMSSKRFKWTTEHECLMLREIMASEIWMSKPGSAERRETWKKIVASLSEIEKVRFDVSARSAREHFQIMFSKRRSKNREEERASGISPEPSEADMLLDEIIELFDNASQSQQAAAQNLKATQKAELARAEEMRRQSVETFGESKKRKHDVEGEGEGSKKRTRGRKTLEMIEDKIKFDQQMKEKELEVRKKEIEEKAKAREYVQQQETRTKIELDEVQRKMNEICNRLNKQDEMLNTLLLNQERLEKSIKHHLEK